MALETLSDRIASLLEARKVQFQTKKMFGGVCFLVDDKMCVGSQKESLMVRFDPALHDDIMSREGVRKMDFTKKILTGFAFIEPWAIETDDELSHWIQLALEFNPRAKSSKKKH